MTFATTARIPGRTSWTPATEGGLLVWYRAEDLSSLSDGDNVTTWTDQSGNSRGLARYWGASYPKYKTGITPSGRAVVRFAGDAALASAAFSMDSTSSLFYFGTAKAQSNAVTVTHGDVGGNGYSLYHETTSAFRGVFGGVSYVGTTSPSTTFKSYGLLMDTGTNKGTFLVNDTSAGTTTSNFNSSSSYGFVVGGNANEAITRYTSDDICEIVYFDHVLNATARANLQEYFNAKYL
jgi:hypothetical protein